MVTDVERAQNQVLDAIARAEQAERERDEVGAKAVEWAIESNRRLARIQALEAALREIADGYPPVKGTQRMWEANGQYLTHREIAEVARNALSTEGER